VPASCAIAAGALRWWLLGGGASAHRLDLGQRPGDVAVALEVRPERGTAEAAVRRWLRSIKTTSRAVRPREEITPITRGMSMAESLRSSRFFHERQN